MKVPGAYVEQPNPQVTAADVRRVVRRHFPEQVENVTGMLCTVGEECSPRVHLAILKLADGDIQRLRDSIRTAKLDWRDVLAPAEYPEYEALNSCASEHEKERAIRNDWAQYTEWLHRP